MTRSFRAGVLAFGLWAAVAGAVLGAPPERATTGVLIPAYIYPAGEGIKAWDRLIAAAEKVPIVAIINAASGPGTQVNRDLGAVFERAGRSKLTVVGYVPLSYAKRPIAAVKADIDGWLKLYPGILDGIFFDEQPSGADGVPYVGDCFAYARQRIKDARIVSNPGTACAAEYPALPGKPLICVHENKTGPDAYRPPSWAGRFDADQVAVVLYDVPAGDAWQRSLRELSRQGAGYVYVTDDSGANPWDRLPAYWEDEVAAIADANRRAAPARKKR